MYSSNNQKALDLETLDDNLFRCKPEHLWKPLKARGIFGGQIYGLALVAAAKTVPESHLVHVKRRDTVLSIPLVFTFFFQVFTLLFLATW